MDSMLVCVLKYGGSSLPLLVLDRLEAGPEQGTALLGRYSSFSALIRNRGLDAKRRLLFLRDDVLARVPCGVRGGSRMQHRSVQR